MRLHVTIQGRVQGVGYRYFVIQTAQKLGITGWVRNCANRDVESEAQGSENLVEEFLKQIKTGHPWARIDRIVKETITAQAGEKNFELRY